MAMAAFLLLMVQVDVHQVQAADTIVEAESMTLSGFNTDSTVSGASNGSVIKTTGTGTATFTYSGTSGTYAIDARYYDWDSGKGKYRVKMNGTVIDEWYGSVTQGSKWMTRSVKSSVQVNAGDIFVLEGVALGQDAGQFDYLKFTTASSPSNLSTGQLLEDTFYLFGNAPGGWDVEAGGGTFTNYLDTDTTAYDRRLRISDTSSVLPVTMSKDIIAQTGKITFEAAFKLVAKVDGVSFQLRSGNTVAVKLITSGGNLAYENSSGTPVTLQSYNANTWYGVKVEADPTSDTADIYVNGIRLATGVAFRNNVAQMDRVFISTSSTGTGDLDLHAIKVYKGYLVHENFLSGGVGNTPSDWTVSGSGGTANIQNQASQQNEDIRVFKFNDTSTTSNLELSKTFTAQTGKVTFEYNVNLPVKVDNMYAELRNGSTTAVKIYTASGNIAYESTSGSPVTLWTNYKANIYYNIKVVANPATDTADIYVNKQLIASGAPFRNAVSSVDNIRFVTSTSNTGVMYVDDIKVYSTAALPSTYVPTPSPASNGDYLIGVQHFMGWKEGHQQGWDKITKYADRKPKLGWYDEGNPEVTDWHLKWMADNGIDFFFTTWFRNAGGSGQPIKTPYLDHGYDAYFNAQYKNYVKFAILYENNNVTRGVSGQSDFVDNVFGYWLEHYLKNPNYLKIDSKPLIGIYNSANLKSQLGGTDANVKAAFDAIRQAAVDAGFAGLIIVAEDRNPTSGEITSYKNQGYDHYYAYVGPTTSSGLTSNKSAGAGILDDIPSPAMGWADEPWYGTTSDTRLPASTFQSLLQFTKDTLMPSYSSGSISRKMILLDNWNEYGEGHYIDPAEEVGFGYVNAIKNVFYPSAPTPDNATPQSVGLGPYDRLYPRLWQPVQVPATPSPPTGVIATPGNGQVSISWSESYGAVSYSVKRSTTAGGTYTTIATGLTGTSYSNTGLTNGTTYYYVVTATNSSSLESSNSSEVSATPAIVSGEIVIDDGDSGYAETGTWNSSSLTGYSGDSRFTIGDNTIFATWTPTISAAGNYQVYVMYADHPTNLSGITYRITHSGGSTDVVIDQTNGGGTWVSLGSYSFASGTGGNVKVYGAGGTTRADAMKFVPVISTLLSDDFEDGNAMSNPAWTASSGTWSVVTDGGYVYKQTATTGEAITSAGNSAWTNFTFTSDMKMFTGGSSGLAFRYQDANNFYLFRLLNNGGKAQLYKKVGGTMTLLAETTKTNALNTWYTLRVVVNGTNIKCYVDNMTSALIDVTDSTYSSGKIGFRVLDTTVQFDNITVQ